MRLINALFILLFYIYSPVSFAQFSVQDDMGHSVTLDKPARRIISLAPHLTETIFTAGAGQYLIGVVQYSDYPPAAKKIKRVGGYSKLDVEAVIALKPDLVVVWHSGNNRAQLEKLKKFGLKVYINEPGNILDIATLMEKLGVLTDNKTAANKAADHFRKRYHQLKQSYQNRKPVSGFYQVWNKPLLTVSSKHSISQVMNLCGISNVFTELSRQELRISTESVLEKDPQMIIASGMNEARPDWLDDWRKWKSMQAVKNNNLYFIPPSIIQRHSPRILDATAQLCEQAEQARKNLQR